MTWQLSDHEIVTNADISTIRWFGRRYFHDVILKSVGDVDNNVDCRLVGDDWVIIRVLISEELLIYTNWWSSKNKLIKIM